MQPVSCEATHASTARFELTCCKHVDVSSEVVPSAQPQLNVLCIAELNRCLLVHGKSDGLSKSNVESLCSNIDR